MPVLDSIRSYVSAELAWRKAGQGVGWPAPGWAPPPGYTPRTAAGTVVNSDNAFTVSAYYAGVRVIAEDVAALPLITYRLKEGGTKERATDTATYRLLHDQPNSEMTSFVFRETAMGHLLTWGNFYAEKELSGTGQVLALWPLRPDRMTVTVDADGKRVYTYRVRDYAKGTVIPTRNIFHVPGLGFDGISGYSPLRMARETIASAMALRDYGQRVLANDARPGVVLKHPGRLSKIAQANIKDSWQEDHQGVSRAGLMAVLEEGMDISNIGFPPEDIQFLQSQQWQVTEIARWLRLAPHKIGDLTYATFSNIEEQNIDHVSSTLRPWLIRWEQQLQKDVLPPGLFTEHLMDAAMRGRTIDRFQAYLIAEQGLAMTPNEWRALENWNPVPWGDEPVRGPNNTDPNKPTIVEQVTAGLRTENEARELLALPPIEWGNALTPDETTSLLEQYKAGVVTHDEVRAMLNRKPVEWPEELGPDEVTSLIEQVKAGLLTEDEARALMNRPAMAWAEGPSPDQVTSLVEQVKEGLLTLDEARASLGRAAVAWPEDLSEKVAQADSLIKAGFEPADVLSKLGLPPMKHIGLPPVTVQKLADAENPVRITETITATPADAVQPGVTDPVSPTP